MSDAQKHWMGLDIGGANIKIAETGGRSRSAAFPLWKKPDELAAKLTELIEQFGSEDSCVAVTMTGELADCYRTKREGVTAIVDATRAACSDRELCFYTTGGTFAEAEAAIWSHVSVAAANWHALTAFACSVVSEKSADDGMLLDIGSTTCDAIPFVDGLPENTGLTDTERLIANELVYTGVGRTPVCSLIAKATYRGQDCPIARELFATTLDCHLMLGNVPELEGNSDTADGRPATRSAAIDRLARMICADRESFDESDALVISEEVQEAQLKLIFSAVINRLMAMKSKPTVMITSGEGEFLADEILNRLPFEMSRVSLSSLIGSELSKCAPAYAVAMLAARQCE